MISPLIWLGGKGLMINRILKYIPDHTCYLEPFFGGGNMFFSKNPVSLETINDINSDVINFFRLLQDKKKFNEFNKKIQLTPYSREIFNIAKEYKNYDYESIERSYYWFVLLRQSFSGKCAHWSYSLESKQKENCQTIGAWLNVIKLLPEIVNRLKHAQIENDDFEIIINRYDNENCFIYCDPPYLHETRKSKKLYTYEMTNEDHERFLKCCLKAKGKIMISGYDSNLYNNYLSGWIKEKIKVKIAMNNSKTSKRADRTEILWMNYEQQQKDLFYDLQTP